MNIKPLIRTWDVNEDKPYFERQWWGGYLDMSPQEKSQIDKKKELTDESRDMLTKFAQGIVSGLASNNIRIYAFNTRGLIDIMVTNKNRPVLIIGGYWAGGTFIEPTIDIFENEVYMSEMGPVLYDTLQLAKTFEFKQAVPKAY